MFSAGQIVMMVVLGLVETSVAALGIFLLVHYKRKLIRQLSQKHEELLPKYNAMSGSAENKEDTETGDTEDIGDELEDSADDIPEDDESENDAGSADSYFAIEAETAATVADEPSVGSYRLAKSFTAKLILSDDVLKERYSELKNALLSYKKVKARTSWKCETFRFGRAALAKIMIRGKKLCLYLALSAEEIPNAKYKVENVGGSKANSETPTVYKVKNALRVKNSKQLIAFLAQKHGLTSLERETENFAPAYKTEEELLACGLIRRVKGSPFIKR